MLSWIAWFACASSHAQPSGEQATLAASTAALDSVRVITLPNGSIGFWLPRQAVLDYRELLVTGLPRYERALAAYARQVHNDSLLIERLSRQVGLLERNLIDYEALSARYEEELANRDQIERLYERALRRLKLWRVVGPVGLAVGAAGLVVAVL